MKDQIRLCLKAASFAVFFDLFLTQRVFYFGADAASLQGTVLGIALSAAIAFFVVHKFWPPPHEAKRRFLLLLPLLASWILFLFILSQPYPLAGILAGPALGDPVWKTALIATFLIFPGCISLMAFSKELTNSLPSILMGASVGLAVQEFLFLPFVGWLISSFIWIPILFFSILPETEERRRGAMPLPMMGGLAVAFIWGVIAGGMQFFNQMVLTQTMSSTRFSYALLVILPLLGLSFGAYLTKSLLLQEKQNKTRYWIFAGVSVLAVVFGFLPLMRLAIFNPEEPLASFLKLGGASPEILLVLVATGLSAVLLGVGLQSTHQSRVQFPGTIAGIFIGMVVILPMTRVKVEINKGQELPFVNQFVHMRYGEQFWERKVTENGVIGRIRSKQGDYGAAIHFHRGPITSEVDKDPEFPLWEKIQHEEILLPVRLSQNTRSMLIVGTPWNYHNEAIVEANYRTIDFVDPIPSLTPITRYEGETDPFRFVAKAPDNRYDTIIALAERTMRFGSGLRLTSTYLNKLSSMLTPEGNLFIWLDLRSLTPENIHPIFETFFDTFPKGRMWFTHHGLSGPLLCLEAKSEASVEVGENHIPLTVSLGYGDQFRMVEQPKLNSALHPVTELSLSQETPRFGLPSPDTLRHFAKILNPNPKERSAIWYWLDALALHAENQFLDPIYFQGRYERINVSWEELEQISIGLEQYPENASLLDYAYFCGNLLFTKRDYNRAMEFFKRWEKILPDNPKMLYFMGRLDHELLDHDLALPRLERAVALDPGNANMRSTLGKAFAALGRWKDAAFSFDEAKTLNPLEPSYIKEAGIAYFKMGNYDKAEQNLLQAKTLLLEDNEVDQYIEKINNKKQE